VDVLTTTAAAQEAGCIHGAATALLAVLGELALGPPSVAGLASPVGHPVTVVLRRDAQCHDPRRDLRERHLKLDQTLRRAFRSSGQAKLSRRQRPAGLLLAYAIDVPFPWMVHFWLWGKILSHADYGLSHIDLCANDRSWPN
jgi:hypothetical protein